MASRAVRRSTFSGSLALLLATLGVVGGCDSPEREAEGTPLLRLTALPPIDAEFGRIAGLVVGEDSSLFVLDGLRRNLRAFDRDGTLLWTFGARGEGPGEFEQPAALFTGPNSGLWIADTRTGRLTEVGVDGALVQTYRYEGPPPFQPLSMGFAPDGLLYGVGLDFSVSPEEPGAALVEYEVQETSVSARGGELLPFVEWPQIFAFRSTDVTFMMPVPFDNNPLFGVDPSGRVHHAQSSGGTIQRLSANGVLELAFGRDLPSMPLGAEERAEALDRSEEAAELRQLAGAAGIAELTSLIPDDKPLLRGLFFDDENNVWVLRTSGSGAGGMRDVDVYDEQGSLIGVGELPVVADPRPHVRDGLIVGVIRDELGVETVARYRVSR